MAKLQNIPGFNGNQYLLGSKDYEVHRDQYATSSYADLDEADRMTPGLIVEPKNQQDIAHVISYAKAHHLAIAIRTGGHQYSGASSTFDTSIQIDVHNTFRGDEDRKFIEDGDNAFVRTSISWSLLEFNKYLGTKKVFVPHGQCIEVHLGGHVQSGGYGQLGRSFGLLGDHVTSLEVVDHEGTLKVVTKTSDKELFYALLGGSPGNLGVITHFTIKVHRDSDYKGSRGVKAVYIYTPEILKGLLQILAEMSDDENFPRNYDFCISVLSESNKIHRLVNDEVYDDLMEYIRGHNSGSELGAEEHPRLILVYAQWVPFSKEDVADEDWFHRVKANSIPIVTTDHVKDMSELTSEWLFRASREFDHPYVKRTHASDLKNLSTNGWVTWMTDRIDNIIKPLDNSCWLSAQLQNFGGKNSKFFTNADNGTSLSWRDSTLVCTLDCFYSGDDGKATATEWARVNDDEGIGANGKVSKEDRRVLWGSYGSVDLDASWRFYYENEEKYKRLGRARQAADPDGVFTANTFAVKRVASVPFEPVIPNPHH